MGTGKSSMAQATQRELGWVLLSSDAVRKRLAHLEPSQPMPESFDQGIYSQAWTSRTYKALEEEAGNILADGRSVLLDATFLRQADRLAAARRAAQVGARTIFLECSCPRELALQRLAQRWEARIEGKQEGLTSASSASDARPALYDEQAACWEAYVPDEEPTITHLVLSTAQPLDTSLRQTLDALRQSAT